MPKNTPVVGELSPNGHPYSRCDRCGQVDDHPKNVIPVGVAEAFGQSIYHPDDADHDGTLRYHHDCPHEWQGSCDPRTVAAAEQGTRGDALRALIQSNHGERA